MAELREVNPPLIGRRLRVIPLSTHPKMVCLRVELYGCPWTGRCSLHQQNVHKCANWIVVHIVRWFLAKTCAVRGLWFQRFWTQVINRELQLPSTRISTWLSRQENFFSEFCCDACRNLIATTSCPSEICHHRYRSNNMLFAIETE